MNPVGARSAEKRRQILDAARDAFSENGFHAASMAEIASRAGISVGHIYRYFENKEAVIVAIVEADLEDAAIEIAAIEGDARAVAAHIVEHIELQSGPKDRALMLEILAEAARNPRVADRVRAADIMLRDHLCAALASRMGAHACGVESRVEVICALIEGLMVRTVKTADGDRRAVAARVEALLVETMTA